MPLPVAWKSLSPRTMASRSTGSASANRSEKKIVISTDCNRSICRYAPTLVMHFPRISPVCVVCPRRLPSPQPICTFLCSSAGHGGDGGTMLSAANSFLPFQCTGGSSLCGSATTNLKIASIQAGLPGDAALGSFSPVVQITAGLLQLASLQLILLSMC